MNTSASISLSQINSSMYFTNGNVGFNTTVPASTVDISGTFSASGLSSLSNVTANSVSTGVLIASTGVTTGTISASGTSTLQNVTATNVSTGVLIASTGVTTGTISASETSALQNVTATNVSTGVLIASTGITTGTISASGTSTLQNVTATNVSTGILIASTGLTTGTISASGTSTLQNVTAISVTTGTLTSTTSVSSGLLSATNVIGNFISAGTLSGTTITGANLSLSGNLTIAGTLTTVNITSSNVLNTNVSAGTIASTNATITNIVGTNISAGTGIFTNGLTIATSQPGVFTNRTITSNTNFGMIHCADRPGAGNLGSFAFSNADASVGYISINTPNYTLEVAGSARFTGGITVGNIITLNDNRILLRGNNDAAHGLAYSAGPAGPDGPSLWGTLGGTLAYGVSGANRVVTWNSTGVGIGTVSPAARLHLANPTTQNTNNIVFEAGTTADGLNAGWSAINWNGYYNNAETRINTGKNRWRIAVDQRSTTDSMSFDTYNGTTLTTIMSFLTNGNVNINNGLTVDGVVNLSTLGRNNLNVGAGFSSTAPVAIRDNSTKLLEFFSGASSQGHFGCNGNGNIFFSSSMSIGTLNSPGYTLDVNGTGRFNGKLTITGTATATGFNTATNDQYAEMRVIRNSTGPDKNMFIQYQAGASSSLYLYSNNTETMVLNGTNVGIGVASPSSKLHVNGNRINLHNSAGTGGGQNLFGGLENVNHRAQIVLSSQYSDLVIASSTANEMHGSTLTFASYNPSNSSDYRKWVINQGGWGSRFNMLEFGYNPNNIPNPHSGISDTYTTMTLDGTNKRLGINNRSPSYTLDVNGTIRGSSVGPVAHVFGTNSGTNHSIQIQSGIGNIELGVSSGGGSFVSGANSGDAFIRATTNKGVVIQGNGGNGSFLYVTNNGNGHVGIDNVGPSAFSVKNASNFTASGSGDQFTIAANGVNGGNGYFYYNSGNGFGTGSDERLKYNITPINSEDAIAFISNITPSDFCINGQTEKQSGFIAQNVLAAAQNDAQKSAVANWETYDETDPECPFMGVSDRPILSNLIVMVKDHQTSLQALDSRLSSLEQQIN
jgi:hypothetical protein